MAGEPFGAMTELGRRYLRGSLRQQAIEGEFLPSRKSDVRRYDAFTADECQRWSRNAREIVSRGEVAFSVLAAGASSRMDLRNLPAAVVDMLRDSGRSELPTSKALVPVVALDGRVYDYLDLFLVNVRRFSEATGASGPVILFVSETNRAEIQSRLDATERHGLAADRIWMFEQPLEAQIVATEADLLEATRNFAPERLEATRDIARNHAGRELKQRKPAGHGEFLHQLVASGTLSRLLARGVRYVSVRNIDNSAALLDHVWLAALGYLRQADAQMLVEVSQRPTGQKGGALIRRGDRWQIAEDPSFTGTRFQASDSYYINNAVAIVRVDFFYEIYETSPAELLDALSDESRQATRLAAIAQRGRRKFPTLVEPKPVALEDGRVVAAVLPETNMWESTGVGAAANLLPLAVDSDQDAGDDLLALADNERARRAARVRFLPTKHWSDYEDPRKQFIARVMAERAVSGDLTR